MDFLTTKNLILRKLRMEDVEQLIHILSDPVNYYRHSMNPPSAKQLSDTIHDLVYKKENWVVLDKKNQQIFGMVLIEPTQPSICANYHMTLWFPINHFEDHIAEEAFRRMLQYIFEAIGAHRVYTCCDSRDSLLIGIYQKMNMRREGIRSSLYPYSNPSIGRIVWRDVAVFAIIKDDWMKVNPGA